MDLNDLLTRFTPAAHRGASRQYPENTLEAFQRALEILPQCLLEIDVRRTSEGEVVVFHDEFLDPKTDGTGPVAAKTVSEIRRLDLGYGISFDDGTTFPFRSRGFRIPTLEETLEAFPSAKISVDIKDDDLNAAVRAVSAINEKKAGYRVIIGSFHSRIVRFVRIQYPHIATHFSRMDIMRFLLLHKAGVARFYPKAGTAMFIPEFADMENPEYREGARRQGMRIISPRLIRDAHRMGIPVVAWTINRIENMRRLISWGVDGIVTDYPDLLKQVMGEKGLIDRRQ